MPQHENQNGTNQANRAGTNNTAANRNGAGVGAGFGNTMATGAAGVGGAAAGAALGSLAGPAGTVAGAAIGGITAAQAAGAGTGGSQTTAQTGAQTNTQNGAGTASQSGAYFGTHNSLRDSAGQNPANLQGNQNQNRSGSNGYQGG